MPITKQKREFTIRKVGPGLRPDMLYTTEGCMTEGGLGSSSLDEARQSGMVRPVEHGRRLYYLGEELIAWLKSKRARHS